MTGDNNLCHCYVWSNMYLHCYKSSTKRDIVLFNEDLFMSVIVAKRKEILFFSRVFAPRQFHC